MIDKDAILVLFDELLAEYENEATTSAWNYASRPEADIEKVKQSVQEYRQRIEALLIDAHP